MYIVTIREKGKDKPLLERECECVIGAFGSGGEAHCLTGIQGKRQTLISTYASALMGLKTLETEFPGLVDPARRPKTQSSMKRKPTNRTPRFSRGSLAGERNVQMGGAARSL